MTNILIDFLVGGIIVAISVMTITVVAWLVILLLEVIFGFSEADYLDTQLPTKYVCKNKYQKWVNALRFVSYIFISYIPQKFSALGFYIGKNYYNTSKKHNIWTKIKNKLIYSSVDTCKD